MHLYLNATPLQFANWSGVQLYSYRVIDEMSRLAPQHVFHLHLAMRNAPTADARLTTLLEKPNVRAHYFGGILPSYAGLPLSLLRTRAAVYFLMNGDGRLRIPVPCPTATVVHDCGRYLMPEYYNVRHPAADLARARRHLRARDLILTISRTIKRELITLFDLDPDRIVVAPCAMEVPPAQSIAPHGFTEDSQYLLMVNPGRPYKNWQDALAAFNLLLDRPNTHPALQLVLAGELRSETEAINQALAANPRLKARTTLLGYVSPEQLRWLYEHADAFIMPSRYEGFGMPLLESMAHRTPVITADIPVLREVAANAALYTPLNQPQLLADALNRVLTDHHLRNRLIEDGLNRAKTYTWQASATTTLEALLQLAHSRGKRAASPVPAVAGDRS